MSTTTIISIIASFLIPIGTSIFLLIFFKRRFDITFNPLIVGMLTFFFFTIIFERIAYSFLLRSKAIETSLDNPWLYLVISGLMMGIFAETGRWFMMNTALKKYRDWKDGLSFGLGFGGFEAIYIVGLSSVMMLVYSFLINNGQFDAIMQTGNAELKTAMTAIKDQLLTTPAYVYWISAIERVSAIAVQLGLSILVLYAVVSRKIRYYFLSILMNALTNVPSALYQRNVIENLFVMVLIVVLFAVVSIYWIIKAKEQFKHIAPSR